MTKEKAGMLFNFIFVFGLFGLLLNSAYFYTMARDIYTTLDILPQEPVPTDLVWSAGILVVYIAHLAAARASRTFRRWPWHTVLYTSLFFIFLSLRSAWRVFGEVRPPPYIKNATLLDHLGYYLSANFPIQLCVYFFFVYYLLRRDTRELFLKNRSF